MPPLFNKVVIVGVGLIGSSIGMNLVQKGLAREVIGAGRDTGNLRIAVRRRAIHRSCPPLPKGGWGDLSKDDLVILATPVRSIIRYISLLPKEVLVTDVGSTKGSILREAVKRKIRFVGSHPIAGTERGGAAAGEIDLFRGKLCLLTPASSCRSSDLAKIKTLWNRIGSRTILMEGGRHDRLLAGLSHLPHAAAFALMESVSHLVSWPKEARLALGGLKDMTRIAASPPEIWRDIFLENRKFILSALKRYLKDLSHLRSLVARGNAPGLIRLLRRAQKMRLQISKLK